MWLRWVNKKKNKGKRNVIRKWTLYSWNDSVCYNIDECASSEIMLYITAFDVFVQLTYLLRLNWTIYIFYNIEKHLSMIVKVLYYLNIINKKLQEESSTTMLQQNE